MTLHKIDREKLKKALIALKGNVQDWQVFQERYGASPHKLRNQAAENWLAITDPGFEPSEEMKEAGESYAYGEYVENAVDGFKAMIATMIKGE